MSKRVDLHRRNLLKITGIGASGIVLGSAAQAAPSYPAPTKVDTGSVEGGKVKFPNWRAPADTPSGPTPAPMPPSERVGFAIVGLGRLALEEILPAFGESKKAKPVALVSGTPEKLTAVARQYGIADSACFDYAGFDRIRDDPEIKVVYILLPNAMHREFVERAAAAGKHVLCEKPMATSSADARAMVAACEKAAVKLMIAYRIQYEVYNRRLAKFVREKTFGRLLGMSATNVQTVAENGAEQWRHKRIMSGGGSLPDIGLYCLNTARFLTGEEPIQVFAHTVTPPNDPRFADVEETVSFQLIFPSGFVANCFTSYGGRDDKHHRLNFEKAVADMPNAYLYEGQRLIVTARKEDATNQDEIVLKPKNQFAAEIDHMADCILQDRKPRTPGEEGVQDQILMEAIYESAKTGAPVRLKAPDTLDAFRGPPLPEEG